MYTHYYYYYYYCYYDLYCYYCYFSLGQGRNPRGDGGEAAEDRHLAP